MAENSIAKSIARFTRPVRALFTRKGFARWSRVPRTLLTGGGVAERVIELEDRVGRLQTGWNHHIPGLLESMSEALEAAYQAEDVHRRIDAVREDLDRVTTRLELCRLEMKTAYVEGGARPNDVTLVVSGDRQGHAGSDGSGFQAGPGSISGIMIGPLHHLPGHGQELDRAIDHWIALLERGGQIQVERVRLTGLPETEPADGPDLDSLRRVSALGGLMSSPEFPTDDQIVETLLRGGLEGVGLRTASSSLARTIVGRKSQGFEA